MTVAIVTASRVTTRLLHGFDDPALDREQWNELLARRGGDIVYLTWEYQRAWWETVGDGRLLLVAAERDGEIVALAPFFADEGMVYFVASDFESDRLDFVGDVGAPGVLEALLATARDCVPGFEGFRLYFVPDASGTRMLLKDAARRLGLSCYREEDMATPVADLTAGRGRVLAALDSRHLRRRERTLRRLGTLSVVRSQAAGEILPHLERLFELHVGRRGPQTANPSRFVHEGVRECLRRFTLLAGRQGWLRLTRLDLDGRPIALHYGFAYRGRSYWGFSAFEPGFARYSPGRVLERQLVVDALAEGARVFDFGPGTQVFKQQFATGVEPLHTWGLYPRGPGDA